MKPLTDSFPVLGRRLNLAGTFWQGPNGTVCFTQGERLNLAGSGKRFDCDFIEPGIVSYTDIGEGYELLRRETIEDALNTFIGGALTLRHVTTFKPVPKDRINGLVDRVGFNSRTGFFSCEGSVDTDEARREIARGLKPSCGYTALEFGPGGVYHRIPYEREITKIKFHHLAIVPVARYEDAQIRLNSKNTNPMFIKLWRNLTRKKADGSGDETVREAIEVPADTEIEIDGQASRLNGVVESHQAAEKAKITETQRLADEEKARKEVAASRTNSAPAAINGDDEVEVDGKPVKVSVLVASHRERHNAAAEETKRKEQERQNGANSFNVLNQARNVPAQSTERTNSAGTLNERVALGASRYGSTKAGKN